MAKRLFDLVLAVTSLILLSPVLLVVSLAIKLDSRGSVLYRAERVGQGGKRFCMWKFRTMVAHADRVGPALTAGRDPRVTRVGRVLRRWKLDEIPQLLNVLRGEMSIVGPRPEAPCYVERYTPGQRRVLDAKPGITGLTQIRFRHEEELLQNCADLEEEYVREIMPRKLTLDLEYIDNRSLILDLELCLRTALALFERGTPVPPQAEPSVSRGQNA